MIKKLTQDFLNKVIVELKKDDNKKKINDEILKPIIEKFTKTVYPYVTLLFTMYTLNLIIIVVILILIIFKKK